MAKNGEDEKGSGGKASTSGVVLTISRPYCNFDYTFDKTAL